MLVLFATGFLRSVMILRTAVKYHKQISVLDRNRRLFFCKGIADAEREARVEDGIPYFVFRADLRDARANAVVGKNGEI